MVSMASRRVIPRLRLALTRKHWGWGALREVTIGYTGTKPLQKTNNEAHQNIKEACGEVKKTAEDVRNKVDDAADKVIDNAFDNAPKIVAKAKDAWDSAKDASEKILNKAKDA